MEPILTEEQKKDVEERVAEFSKRHEENTNELGVDFVSFPQYMQIAPNAFATYASMHIVDTKYAPIPSPLSDELQ